MIRASSCSTIANTRLWQIRTYASSYSEACVATVFASLGHLSGNFGEIQPNTVLVATALRVLILSRLIPPSVPYRPTALSLTTEEAVSLSLLISIYSSPFVEDYFRTLVDPGLLTLTV